MNILRSELSKTRELVFTCLGPTPFHADFCITPGPVQNDRIFEHTVLESRGYSQITFRYEAASGFSSAQAAFEALIEEVDYELDCYYFVISQSSENYKDWGPIERLFSDLIGDSQPTDWWQRMRNARSRSRSFQELSIRLARFQAKQIANEYHIRKAFYETYNKNIPCYFRAYVEAAMKERPVFPTEPIADLLGFLERRRLKGAELRAILVAAMVGGLSGSLLTVFLSQ